MHDRRRALFQADDAAVEVPDRIQDVPQDGHDLPSELVNAPVSVVNAMIKWVDVLVVGPGGRKKIASTIAIVLPNYGMPTS